MLRSKEASRHSGGHPDAFHHISGENTYPRTCSIKHFLGFTHFCGQRHKTETFTVWRITAKKRMVAKLKIIKAELQRRKHDRTSQVGVWLRSVVTGYYQYHAVPGNIDQLRIFQRRVNRLWRNVLVRRSQRGRKKWEKFAPVFDRWIPPPRVLHPYPDTRFYTTHPS